MTVESKQSEKPYVPDFTDLGFENTLQYQPYFSFIWEKGCSKVHNSILRTIKGWAGMCTEPNEGIHYFNNQTAMFSALDMIYKLIDEAEDGFVEFDEDIRGDYRKYVVPRIEKHNSSISSLKNSYKGEQDNDE